LKGRGDAGSARALMRRGMSSFLRGIAQVARSGGGRARLGPETVNRVVRAWGDDLLAGYRTDPSRILLPLRARHGGDLVALRDLEFSSVCLHHLLPFTGRAHLAYAPAGRITGLSRLAKLVDCLSRRLQLQEPLTREIAEEIQRQLAPEGAVCVIEASHTCMTSRGDRRGARILTTAFTGVFRANAARRREVVALLQVRGGAAATGVGRTRAARRARGKPSGRRRTPA